MVTQINEKGHKIAEIPLFEAIEFVRTGEYDWKIGNIIQKRMNPLPESRVSLEEVIVDLTMRYIKDETDIPFTEWYAALKNTEVDDLHGLIAHLVGRIKDLEQRRK